MVAHLIDDAQTLLSKCSFKIRHSDLAQGGSDRCADARYPIRHKQEDPECISGIFLILPKCRVKYQVDERLRLNVYCYTVAGFDSWN